MLAKLEEIEVRFKEVESLLSDSTIIADREKYLNLSKEHASLADIVKVYRDLKKIENEIAGNTGDS